MSRLLDLGVVNMTRCSTLVVLFADLPPETLDPFPPPGCVVQINDCVVTIVSRLSVTSVQERGLFCAEMGQNNIP